MASIPEESKIEKEAGTRPLRRDASDRVDVGFDELELRAWMDAILYRHPAVGLAVGIVHDGSLELFDGRGFANIASSTSIDADTVFRIGSITKPFTAVAVMQLHEQG